MSDIYKLFANYFLLLSLFYYNGHKSQTYKPKICAELIALKIIKLLHCLFFYIVAHVDIRLHGFIVVVTSPFHDYLRRDSHAKDITYERSSACVGAYDFIFRFDLIKAFVSTIIGDADWLVKSCKFAKLM